MGTTNIQPSTLSQLLVDVATSLCGQGFRHIILYPCHLEASTLYAARDAEKRLRADLAEACVWVYTTASTPGETKRILDVREDGHAGAGETSAMLHVAVETVRTERPWDPKERWWLGVVAELHDEMGHTDQAIAVYEQAIAQTPENAIPYVRLATLYRKRGRKDEAHEMRGEAVRRAADAPEVLFEVAEMYFEEEDTLWEALKLLEHIVLLDPDHAQAHQLLGDAYLEYNRLKEAIKHLERACELASPDSRLGKEARRKLERLRPSLPDHQVQGWGETCRLMGGLMLAPVLAAFVNARLSLRWVGLGALAALVMTGAGAFLWVCATNVPRNPVMRRVFGPEGVKGLPRQVMVGLPGVMLWLIAFGLILWKV